MYNTPGRGKPPLQAPFQSGLPLLTRLTAGRLFGDVQLMELRFLAFVLQSHSLIPKDSRQSICPNCPPMSLPPRHQIYNPCFHYNFNCRIWSGVFAFRNCHARNCHADSVPYIYLTPGNQPCLCQHEHLFPLALSSAGGFYNGRWLAALRSCPHRL